MSQTAKQVRAESMPPEDRERDQDSVKAEELGAEQAAGSAALESAVQASGAAPESEAGESGAPESTVQASEDSASVVSASGAPDFRLDPDHPRRRELPALLRRGLSFGWAKKDASKDTATGQDQAVGLDHTPDQAIEAAPAATSDQAVGRNLAAHPDPAAPDPAAPDQAEPDHTDQDQSDQTRAGQEETPANPNQAAPTQADPGHSDPGHSDPGHSDQVQAAPVIAYAPPPRSRFPIYLALAGMALVLVLYIIGLNSSLAAREAALKEEWDRRLNGVSQQLGAAEGRIATLETRQDGMEATMERKITARQVAELRQSLEQLAAQADPSERERLARAKALLDELEAALN